MMENIQKPITMVRQEFINALVDVINNYNLPLFIIEPILRDVYLEVKSLSNKQCEIEKMEYEKKVQECKKDIEK